MFSIIFFFIFRLQALFLVYLSILGPPAVKAVKDALYAYAPEYVSRATTRYAIQLSEERATSLSTPVDPHNQVWCNLGAHAENSWRKTFSETSDESANL